jgi:hypothetical protein
VAGVTEATALAQATTLAKAKQATWWLVRNNGEHAHYGRYYAGRHRLAYATSKYRDAFGALFSAFGVNFCATAIDTVASRIEVSGFSADDPGVADDAWRSFTDLGLDGYLSTAFKQALVYGEAYLVADPKNKTITVEDSKQMYVVKDPADPTKIVFAFKAYIDVLDGFSYGIVYEPDKITYLRSREPSRIDPLTGLPSLLVPTMRTSGVEWTVAEEVSNPIGKVPIFVLANSPDANHRGRSALQSLVPVQDAINKLANDLIVASEFQAFRQRVVTGIEIPKNPETGEPLPAQQLEAAMSRLWAFEGENVKVTDLGEANLSNYSDAMRVLIGSFSVIAVLPPTYFVAVGSHSLSNVSGEAVAALELAHIARCEELTRLWRGPLTEAIRMALGIEERLDIEFRPIARPSLSTVADWAVKAKSVGVSSEEVFRAMGYTPTQIKKMLDAAPSRALATPDPRAGA